MMLSWFGDLKSATVYPKITDLMLKRNSASSVYCFCHVDEKEQTASEVTGLKLFPQLPLLFFPKCNVVILSERDTYGIQ